MAVGVFTCNAELDIKPSLSAQIENEVILIFYPKAVMDIEALAFGSMQQTHTGLPFFTFAPCYAIMALR